MELAYFGSLLVQTLPQVSDALVHHRHLGVPLVQQILVLGQFAALLQVVTIASLKHRNNRENYPFEDVRHPTEGRLMRASAVPAAPGRVSSAPGLQVRTEPSPCGRQVGPASRPALLVRVPGSAAGGVLFLSPPAAGSAGWKTSHTNVWPFFSD